MGTSLFNWGLSRAHKSTAKWLSIFLVTAMGAGWAQTAHANYPLAKVTNNTEYTVSGKVEYVSMFCSDDSYTVAPGKTWTAKSRGICLIDDITGSTGRSIGNYGESAKITPYHSSPATSYGTFFINAYNGSYRIFSKDEWNKVSDTKHGKSPGFYFVNKTAWPLTYSLDQVGCLYHGIIPTGEGAKGVRKVDTGAVWFTLRIAIQPDGIDPQSNWDCVEPVAELVGDVALAAVSGGATAVAKAGGKVIVKQIAKEAVKAGAKKAVKSAAKKVIKDLGKDELGKLLTDAGSVELYGQYAGYEWPFRCDKMPAYHITGGPLSLRDENGELYLERGEPFKVTKVNSCGNDMMSGSRRSMESDQSAFSSWPGGSGNVPAVSAQWGPETGDPSCVTLADISGEKLQFCGTEEKWSDYIRLGKTKSNKTYRFANKVQSFRCNSGLKSVELLQYASGARIAWRKTVSCQGGNIVHSDGTFNKATGMKLVPKLDPKIAEDAEARRKYEIQLEEARRTQAIHNQDAAELERQQRAEEDRKFEEMAAAQKAATQQALDDRARSEAAQLSAASEAIASSLLNRCVFRGTPGSIERNPNDRTTALQMFNIGSKNIHIYWRDQNGQEVNYDSYDAPLLSIAPGSTGAQQYGGPGDWFIAVDDDGECVGMANSELYGDTFDDKFYFNPDLVVPGTHPRKAAAVADTGQYDQGAYDQNGYDQSDYEQGGYTDPNAYADEGSDYVDPNEYADDQTGYADEGVYQDDTADYDDQSQYGGTMTQGPGCEYYGQVASSDDGQIVEVTFQNYADDMIDIYWIDTSGAASNYDGDGGTVATVDAQSYESINTRIGHMFIATDSNGTCLGVTVASASGETISFSPVQ